MLRTGVRAGQDLELVVHYHRCSDTGNLPSPFSDEQWGGGVLTSANLVVVYVWTSVLTHPTQFMVLTQDATDYTALLVTENVMNLFVVLTNNAELTILVRGVCVDTCPYYPAL